MNAAQCYPVFWNFGNADVFGINGYSQTSLPRVGKKYDGVAIYAKLCLNVHLIVYNSNFTSFECWLFVVSNYSTVL